MTRSLSPLVIASHNEEKVGEIRALLQPLGLSVISASALELPGPEETGNSFAENALIKSESAARLSGHWSLADDSGLSIDALGGAPGIYSARWGGAARDFTVAANRIQQELTAKNVNPNGARAHFTSVLALTSPEGESQTFEGIIEGTLTFPPRGLKGFGYDPIFVADGYTETFGEMEPEAKHRISHRAKAFARFVAYLRAEERQSA